MNMSLLCRDIHSLFHFVRECQDLVQKTIIPVRERERERERCKYNQINTLLHLRAHF